MMTRFTSKFFKFYTWLDALWLLLLSAYICVGISLTPFHADESTQIFMGRDYFYHFVQADWAQLSYSETPEKPAEQDLRLLNGTLPKYLFGWAAYSLGYTAETINEQWDWGADWHYNQSTGHIPPDDLLMRSRLISALFLCGSVIAIFYIGMRVQGRSTAYLASLLYSVHPAILVNGRRAMMESAMLCFSLLVLLSAIHLLRHRKFWHYIVLGMASGLAIISKHTAVFVVVPAYAISGLYSLWHARQKSPVRHIALLLASGLFALTLFYAMNPAWWGDPLARVSTVLDLRQNLLEVQVNAFGGYPDFPARIAGWWRQSFIPQPMYYEVPIWQDYIAEQIMQYELSPFAGIRINSPFAGVMLTILMIFGLFRLLQDKTVDNAVRWIIIGYCLSITLLMLIPTPLEWQRYYLLMIPAIILPVSFGISTILSRGWQRWQNR